MSTALDWHPDILLHCSMIVSVCLWYQIKCTLTCSTLPTGFTEIWTGLTVTYRFSQILIMGTKWFNWNYNYMKSSLQNKIIYAVLIYMSEKLNIHRIKQRRANQKKNLSLSHGLTNNPLYLHLRLWGPFSLSPTHQGNKPCHEASLIHVSKIYLP